MAEEEQFEVVYTFRGKTASLRTSIGTASGEKLIAYAKDAFQIEENSNMKLLLKGKRLEETSDSVFASVPKKMPKIMVLATKSEVVDSLNSRRSDPTLRGFDNEKPSRRTAATPGSIWGGSQQDKNYKFCRFEPCSWQSFGHRPHDTETPHAFAAQRLLEQLATDPGIVAIVRERELVVGTLGEMDPIDDRIMQAKAQEGAHVLGYNTNQGMRIDLKLRPDSLRGFRPYPDLAATLIHELSHNFFSDHNLLFWTNYGHMRVEYLYHHTMMAQRGVVVGGRTTAQIAGVPPFPTTTTTTPSEWILEFVMQELGREMAPHGLSPEPQLRATIQARCQDMQERYGGGTTGSTQQQRTVSTTAISSNNRASPREMALRAAEARAQEQREKKEEKRRNKDDVN